jgi:translation elongation factor EF-1alpha
VYDFTGEEVISMPEIEVGRVSDYFSHIMVAGVDLNAPLHVGDRIHILGHTSDTEMNVDSIQIDHKDIAQAKAGDSVGIRVPERVRRGDMVYLVKP